MGDKLPQMMKIQLMRSVGARPLTLGMALCLTLLMGCGQKGPLSLPKEQVKPAATPASAPVKP